MSNMSRETRSATSRRSARSSPSSPPPSPSPSKTPRRSSRIQKRKTSETISDDAPGSGLTDAVSLLNEIPVGAQPQKSPKRVKFQQATPALHQAQQALASHFLGDDRNPHHNQGHQTNAPSVETNPDDGPGVQRVTSSSNSKNEGRNSLPVMTATLPPTRARKLERLLLQKRREDAMGETFEPVQVAGAKRPRDHHDHHDHNHGDHHQHHGHDRDPDMDDHLIPAKRAKDNKGRIVVRPIPSNPMVYLLSDLGDAPQSLTVGQMSSMFTIIQGRLFGGQDNPSQGFVEKYFGFVLTGAQYTAWPLHDLKKKHLPLFLSTQFVADGSQYGWRNFFTQPQFRQHLVGAIVSEWIVQRIFKHTAFGVPQHILDELEDLDRQYLNYDAVVRTKKRARLLQSKYDDVRLQDILNTSRDNAAMSLAEEILTVIHPLLPPPVFDPLEERTRTCKADPRASMIQERLLHQKTEFRDQIKQDLLNLILDCSALHIAIRLSGRNGTIVRIIPHQNKGSLFNPNGTSDCVNQLFCNRTMPRSREETVELRIKMTCWPRIEAIVPSGPDMDELHYRETEYRKDDLVQKQSQKYRRARRGGVKTATISTNVDADEPVSDSGSDEFTWDTRSELWPIVPPALQDTEGRQFQAGQHWDKDGELNTVKRASYLTLHPSISDAKVYCEWTPIPRSTHKTQTLAEAILQARRHTMCTKTNLRFRAEDLGVDLWNTWAMYGGFAQWGFLAFSALVAVSRHLNVSFPRLQSLSSLPVPSHIKAAVSRALQKINVFDFESRTLASHLLSRIRRALDGRFGPFGIALRTILNGLVVDPAVFIAEFVADVVGWLRTVTSADNNEYENLVLTTADDVAAALASVAPSKTLSTNDAAPRVAEATSAWKGGTETDTIKATVVKATTSGYMPNWKSFFGRDAGRVGR